MKSLTQYINERRMGDGWKTIKIDGYTAYVLAFDEPSQYGINKGNVSKLEIRKDDKVVCSYDRGWDIKPQTDEMKNLVNKIVRQFEENKVW